MKKPKEVGEFMKKLKTLRDIELYHKINTDVKDDYDVLYAELKEAAREWINYVYTFERGDRTYSDLKGIDRDIDLHYYHSELLIEWIKHFFDLENSNG